MKYYLHDSNSFNDEKITLLHINYGYEALGLFYTIIEKLAAQEKPILENVLISQLKIGKKLKKQLNFMYEIDILSINNGEVFSKTLLNFSQKYQIKKEKNTKRVAEWRKNQEIKKNVTCYESVGNAAKVKKSKVNKEIDNKENLKNIQKPKKSAIVFNTFPELQEELINSETWLLKLAQIYNITTTEVVVKLNIFLKEQSADDDKFFLIRSLTEIKRHFRNTLKLNIVKEKGGIDKPTYKTGKPFPKES